MASEMIDSEHQWRGDGLSYCTVHFDFMDCYVRRASGHGQLFVGSVCKCCMALFLFSQRASQETNRCWTGYVVATPGGGLRREFCICKVVHCALTKRSSSPAVTSGLHISAHVDVWSPAI